MKKKKKTIGDQIFMIDIMHDLINEIVLEDGTIIPVKGKLRLVYNTNQEIIGIRTPAYIPKDNSTIKSYFTHAIEEQLVEVVNEGVLSRGAKYYLQMALPQKIVVGNKQVSGMLTALDSRKGNAAFALAITPTFVVCGNTWTSVYSKAGIRVSHLAEEKDFLDAVNTITEEFTVGLANHLTNVYDALGSLEDNPRAFLERIYKSELDKDPDKDVTDLKDAAKFFDVYESQDGLIAADALDTIGLQKSVAVYTYIVSNQMRKSNPIDLISTSYSRGSKLSRMDKVIQEIMAGAPSV
jgi:Domain of unknown function (DUF932)